MTYLSAIVTLTVLQQSYLQNIKVQKPLTKKMKLILYQLMNYKNTCITTAVTLIIMIVGMKKQEGHFKYKNLND